MKKTRLPDKPALPEQPGDATPGAPAVSSSRRVFTRRRLLAGAVAGAGSTALGLAGYACGIEPVWPEIVYHRMPLPGLGSAFVGARIIQLSDLHVGPKVPLDYLRTWVDWTSDQNADFVLVTGDTVHYSGQMATPIAARLLSGLRARRAVLASLGNHEWGACRPEGGRADLAERVARAFAREGVTLLRNQVASFRSGHSELHFVGLDDCWSSNYGPAQAFRALPSTGPTIILSHNPDSFPGLVQGPGHWVLAGHTHGGQVNVPLFGPPILPVTHRQFVAGHYCLGGKNLYVNRGLGWVRRVRFNARPEITVFTLETALA